MRKLRYAIVGLAMLASGLYLFVYLYRWEWHRALVAGVLFLAAEVALLGATILDRLRSIEGKLGAGDRGARGAGARDGDRVADGDADAKGGRGGSREEILARLEDTAPEPRVNFDWLTRRSGEMSVFVPVLLGAGVVLSGVAWVVERLARVTARPAMERGLAVQLAPFSMPVGTLWGAPAAEARPRHRRLVLHLAAAAVAGLVGTVGIDQLSDLTQDRPDPYLPDQESSVVIAASSRPERSTLEATQAIWGACTTQLGTGFQTLSMTDLGGGNVEVVVRPQIGMYAQRRLRGCVADGVSDRVGGHVQSITPVER